MISFLRLLVPKHKLYTKYGHLTLKQVARCRTIWMVWQDVNVLDMDSVENSASRERIHFHVTLWYDEVEDFDNAEVG